MDTMTSNKLITTKGYSGFNKERLFSAILPISLVLSVYLIPFVRTISIGEVAIIGSFVIMLLKNSKIRLFKNHWLGLFTVYAVIASFLVSLLAGANVADTATRIIRDSFYWITIYVFGYSFLDYQEFKKWLIRISLLLSIYIIIQSLLYYGTGYLLPGFPLNATVSTSSSARLIYEHTVTMARRTGYLKANGFLAEAAHCAQALFICNIILLTPEDLANNKKQIRLIILLSVASIMTFSASAIVYVSFIWLLIVLSMMKNGTLNKKMGTTIVAVLFVGLIVAFFIGNNANLQTVIGRITAASSSSTADNSAFFRIYKGFTYWLGLPVEYKVFGIGFGNYNSMISVYTGAMQDGMTSEYMNTASYILVSSGLVGFLLMTGMYIRLFRNGNDVAKYMIIGLILMSLSASPYSSIYWIWMMLIIIYNQKDTTCNYETLKAA